MAAAEERFRRKVAPGDDHDVWTGAQSASGTGLVRIEGTLRSVQRAAWEFAHGPIPAGSRVLSCPQARACVRVEHLRLAGARTPPPPTPERRRAQRGRGSKRELRPGVWRLTVSDGVTPDGRQHRRSLTVYGDEAHAAEALADLAETARGPVRLGDLRVRELLDRYLSWLETGRRSSKVRRLRELADLIVEPAIGRRYAALLDAPDVHRLLRDRHQGGADRDELRAILRLLADAYRWVRDKGWTTRDPICGLTVRDITG